MTAAQSVVEEIVPVFRPPALTVVGGTHSDEVRLHGLIIEAEKLLDVNRHDEAVASLEGIWHETKLEAALALRHLLVVSWAEMYAGHLGVAAELLDRADSLVRLPRFDASQRAELLFRQGCLALKGADVAEASSLFTRALETNERAPVPSLRLHTRAYEWRARCHVLRRDLEAAVLLEGRTDFLDELGNAQLVVAKALAAEGDVEECALWLNRAEATFTALGSASHLAAAWIERGDLARSVGDLDGAAALYRRSAESLQDFHF